MNTNQKHKILRAKILAGFQAASDNLIIERMKINRPLILMRNGKIQKISPFILARERWGDDYSRYL